MYEKSQGCSEYGLCTYLSVPGGRCVAADDQDCADAAVCVEAGKCRAIDGACAQ